MQKGAHPADRHAGGDLPAAAIARGRHVHRRDQPVPGAGRRAPTRAASASTARSARSSPRPTRRSRPRPAARCGCRFAPSASAATASPASPNVLRGQLRDDGSLYLGEIAERRVRVGDVSLTSYELNPTAARDRGGRRPPSRWRRRTSCCCPLIETADGGRWMRADRLRAARLSIAALVVVLLVPFVARSRKTAAPNAGVAHETLVIITANNESIRYEFGRAFREHMARQGRDVDVDWRSPGGAAEIARTLASEYAASFERHWREDLHRRWTVRDRGRLLAPAAPTAPAGEVAEARRAFLASDVGARRRHRVRRRQPGVREVRGGRADRRRGHRPRAIPSCSDRAASRQSSAARPSGIATGAGSARVCPASASVTTANALGRLGIGEPPSSWSAIATPPFRGQLALADPTKSSTSGKASR